MRCVGGAAGPTVQSFRPSLSCAPINVSDGLRLLVIAELTFTRGAGRLTEGWACRLASLPPKTAAGSARPGSQRSPSPRSDRTTGRCTRNRPPARRSDAQTWRLSPVGCTVSSVKSPRPATRRRHARRDVLSGVPDLLVDGRPSAFSEGQGTAAAKGLTLHPEETLKQLIDIQRRIAATAARDKATQETQARARRLRWLTVVTVLLWLSAVVVVLVHG